MMGVLRVVMLCAASVIVFVGCFASANIHLPNHNALNQTLASPTSPAASSTIFPLYGNVYPRGFYNVTLNIGGHLFYLDIDTGSDITWIQCHAPGNLRLPKQFTTGAPHPPYTPPRGVAQLVRACDPLCAALRGREYRCRSPNDECAEYSLRYADNDLTVGKLIKDHVSLQFKHPYRTGDVLLGFGCGYNQPLRTSATTDGVFGLGKGKLSVLSQLRQQQKIRSVVGHCLSSSGGGYMFLGDYYVPTSVMWTPITSPNDQGYYSSGPAELRVNGLRRGGLGGLTMTFDSGSSYTYFNPSTYGFTISEIRYSLRGQPLRPILDPTLPVCWVGATHYFRSISEVEGYFETIVLWFANYRSPFSIPPRGYLIISQHGNVCLGILEGHVAGLGDLNVIGDISMQDKIMVYDNENNRIAWFPKNCDQMPTA